jgi:hypothetical protein
MEGLLETQHDLYLTQAKLVFLLVLVICILLIGVPAYKTTRSSAKAAHAVAMSMDLQTTAVDDPQISLQICLSLFVWRYSSLPTVSTTHSISIAIN